MLQQSMYTELLSCFLFTPQVSMLEIIAVLNPDCSNMVKFYEWFKHMGRTSLSFEMLDGNLLPHTNGRLCLDQAMYRCFIEIWNQFSDLLLISDQIPKMNPNPKPCTAAHGKLNPRLVLSRLFLQLLVALDALRDVSFLHTDIKPDNIMFVNWPAPEGKTDRLQRNHCPGVQPGMKM